MKNRVWNRKKVVLAILIPALGAVSALVGCGNGSGGTYIATNVNPAQIVNLPIGACPGSQDISFLPQYIQTALIGNYTGTLTKENSNFDMVTQPYTFTISRAQAAGSTMVYAYLTFVSNGDGGNVSFQSCLDMQWPATYQSIGSGMTYLLATPTISNAAFSQNSFQLEISLAINGTSFVPAQSSIIVKDCGFSQGVFCSNPSMDVSFENDLVKRP